MSNAKYLTFDTPNTKKTSHMRCSNCQIIWHGWTILFRIWNDTITNAIIKNYFLFFLSPLSSFLSSLSFFFLFSSPNRPLSFLSLSFFFLLSFSPLTHLYMIWRVERREVVDGFSESREKRDGGWVLDLEYRGKRKAF